MNERIPGGKLEVSAAEPQEKTPERAIYQLTFLADGKKHLLDEEQSILLSAFEDSSSNTLVTNDDIKDALPQLRRVVAKFSSLLTVTNKLLKASGREIVCVKREGRYLKETPQATPMIKLRQKDMQNMLGGIDRQIIDLLNVDHPPLFGTVANTLGISEHTLNKRIRSLQREGKLPRSHTLQGQRDKINRQVNENAYRKLKKLYPQSPQVRAMKAELPTLVGKMTQKDIAERYNISQKTVNNAIKKLKKGE